MQQGVDDYRTSGCGGTSWQWPDQTWDTILKLENASLLQSLIKRRPIGASDCEETAIIINVTTEGQKYLCATLGSTSYLELYINGKVYEWVGKMTKLAVFALLHP